MWNFTPLSSFLKRCQIIIYNRGEKETSYSQKCDRYAVQKMAEIHDVNFFPNCSTYYKMLSTCRRKNWDWKRIIIDDDLIHADWSNMKTSNDFLSFPVTQRKINLFL